MVLFAASQQQQPPPPLTTTVRARRKFHNKSRLGCGNCKLRRVKCDEEKPSCDKCRRFGVSCNYDGRTTVLQVPTGVSTFQIPQRPIIITTTTATTRVLLPPITKTMSPHMGNCCLDVVEDLQKDGPQFGIEDWKRLQRFQSRTVSALGTPKVCQLHTRTVLNLAWTRPYLMHLVQLTTALHDRYLSDPTSCKQTPTEIYHWSQAVTQFNRTLSKPINPQDRDALWMTACFIGILAMSMVEASLPEEVWPLKPAAPSDLEWLRMSDGKRAIWKVTNPLRRGGIFHELTDHFQKDYLYTLTPQPEDAILWSPFLDLCKVKDWTDVDNPYCAAVTNLVPLLDMECTNLTQLRFVSFISHMTSEFKALLEQKDPRAMLLFAYWYAKVIHGRWWLARRAKLECQATCIYLERYHYDNKAIQDLLRFPNMKCGLLG